MARGELLRAELNVAGILGAQGELLRAELDAVAQAAGVLVRAELDQASIAAGQLLRVELDSVQSANGQLLRAQLSSTAASDGQLLRAELSSSNVPVQAGSTVTVEPWSTSPLQGSGGNSNPTVQSWSQTAGPAVTLTGTGDHRTYIAPATVSGVTLTFVYNVDGATAEVSHVVLPTTESDVVSRVRRPLNPVK